MTKGKMSRINGVHVVRKSFFFFFAVPAMHVVCCQRDFAFSRGHCFVTGRDGGVAKNCTLSGCEK